VPISPKITIGIIVFMLINLLIIEDHLTYFTIYQKNAKITTLIQELDVQMIVNILTPLLRDCIILTSIKLIYANNLAKKEKHVKRVNFALLSILS
jgi:hypothetical protein